MYDFELELDAWKIHSSPLNPPTRLLSTVSCFSRNEKKKISDVWVCDGYNIAVILLYVFIISIS